MATKLFGDRFEGAVAGTICNALNAAGSGLIETAVPVFMVPGFQLAAAKTAGIGGLLLLAEQLGCTYDAGGKSPSGGTFCGLNMGNVCKEHEVGEGILYQQYPTTDLNIVQYQTLISIGCPYSESDSPDSQGWYFSYRDYEVILADGSIVTDSAIFRHPGENPNSAIIYSRTVDDGAVKGECTKKPEVLPFEGFDGNDCAFTAQLVAMGQGEDGNYGGLILLEGGHQKQKYLDEKQWNRPEPGLINDNQPLQYNQTCNISPMLIYGDMNIEYNYTPINPGEDWQDALDRLRSALGDKIDKGVDDITDDLDEIKDLLDDLPDQGDAVDIPPGRLYFKAPCDVDDDGKQLVEEYPTPAATTVTGALEAIYQNQMTLVQVLQQHLNWKTPICKDEKPKLKGNWITIHFESAKESPNGEKPLRKLFRYRSDSSRSNEELRAYWNNFTWNAGSTIVVHKGYHWGTPKVWAASEAEGKRVIGFAAAESGFDPNLEGEWVVTSSDNSRYGMTGKMFRSIKYGDYWLTSRNGPSELPWQKSDS